MADEHIVISVEAEDNASSKLDKVSDSVKNLNSNLSNTGKGLTSQDVLKFQKNLESAIGGINSTLRQYNSLMSGFNRTTVSIVREAGSAIADFTTDSINNFTKFSEQHAQTLGAMAADYDKTAESQRRFFEDGEKLRQQAMTIGTYGIGGQGALVGIPEVSQLQTEMIKAGVSPDQIKNSTLTEDILRFAVGNQLSTEDAVSFAVSLGNQFNVPQNQWGDLLDKVSHTADLSIIDVQDIVASMKYAGGITAGLGRSPEEVLGIISMMGDFGLKGSQAGSGIQGLFSRILTGDTTVITKAQAEVAPPKALEAFYDFSKFAKSDGSGLTYDEIANAESYDQLGELSGNLRPMSEIIDQMDQVMSELNDEEQAWFAKKFFGLYQMKSAYALMNGDSSELQSVIDEITLQSGGTNENKYGQLLESQYGQFARLKNLYEGTKTDLGSRLSPFVDTVTDELFNFLSDPDNYQINFDNLKTSLDESCDLIEEKYGTAIANAVRNLGDLTIDLTQVVTELSPEFGSGMLQVFQSLLGGNIFGDDGVINNWGTMIDNMHQSAEGLPEDLRGMADAITSVVDWCGKLAAFNAVTEIAQLVTSLLQILTIAGGAVINVAGAVVVNGGAGGTGAKALLSGETVVGGAGGTGAKALLSGETVVGSADDVAKALGTTSDDIVGAFGQQASYTIDDIAKGFGASTDEVLEAYGSSIDDLIAAGGASIDDVVKGGSGLWGSLSGVGKALGIVGTLAQAGIGGWKAYNEFKSGNTKGGVEEVGGTTGGIAGGMLGAKVGGALGTIILPGLGTGIGVMIGVIGGSLGGDALIRDASGDIYDSFTYGTTGFGSIDRKARARNNPYYGKNLNAGDIPIDDAIAQGLISSQLGESLKNAGVTSYSASALQPTEITNAVREGVVAGMAESKAQEPTEALSIYDQAKKLGIQGYAAFSEQGLQQEIINEITPTFNVAAPQVNVDVKVDQNGNVTKGVSILNPRLNNQLNTWYSRNSAQYGGKAKK